MILQSRTDVRTTTTVTAEEGITVRDRAATITRRAITLRSRLKARARTESAIPTDRITAITARRITIIITSSISANRTRAPRRDSSSTVSASPRISVQENWTLRSPRTSRRLRPSKISEAITQE